MIDNQHTTKCWAWLSTNCCTFFWRSSLRAHVLTKSSIKLGSHLRIIACDKNMLLAKYIYKKQLIKNRCNKKDFTTRFACKTNGMEPSACMVTKLWTCWFRLSVLNYDYRVKCVDITCWMYSAHIVSKTYNKLKSFPTAKSF